MVNRLPKEKLVGQKIDSELSALKSRFEEEYARLLRQKIAAAGLKLPLQNLRGDPVVPGRVGGSSSFCYHCDMCTGCVTNCTYCVTSCDTGCMISP